MFRKALLLFVALSVSALTLHGQAKPISFEEFLTSRSFAINKTKGQSHRMSKIQEEYRDDKLIRRDEFVYEYSLPERFRYFHREKSGNDDRRIELIQISNIFNCRVDEGDWIQSISWCADLDQPPGTGINLKHEETVEDVQFQGINARLFHSFGKITNLRNSGMKRPFSYFDDKFWLNSDGCMLREESWRKSEDGKELNITSNDTYEYGLKIIIDAPLQ